MKFYGVEIGCNKYLTSDEDHEVISITVFSSEDYCKVYNAFNELVTESKNEVVGIVPWNCPETNIAKKLRHAKSQYSYNVYHLKIRESQFNFIKDSLKRIFPKKEYIQLEN